jgi:ADP-ribosyl-[dinitrogen reductase] hydrolase
MMVDKALGALYGVAIGDALGAPFEFARVDPPNPVYTGELFDHDVFVHFRFSVMTLGASSITDDTEMTIQLLESLIESKGVYNVDNTILKYLEWANLGKTPMGKNTRALMKGVKTIKGFRNRQKKIDTTGVQSNGSLMRCVPLAFIGSEWRAASDEDVSLTNNNNVNRECSILYLSAMRFLISGEPLEIRCTQPVIKKAIRSALNGEILDVSIKKGWVVHALYVAFITLLQTKSFEEGMDFIAEHFIKGDTDTIMAISGGLLGACYGFEKISAEKKTRVNIKKLEKYFASTTRPRIINESVRTLINLSKN